jgi:WD40 repeat protein
MKLKRVSGQSWSDTRKAEGFISRLASGMSFDFRLGDADVYLAGTEEGTIHKCSCSYNEQYLETFSGHSGPVYQIVASPFHPQVFLSASADWTCRLWHLDYDSARLIFEPCTTYIADVAWSPHNSTVFATVTGDGRLDVWDLTVSAIDPVASFSNNGVTKFSRVRFSANTSAVVVGDEAGRVHTFKITNLDTPPLNAEQMKVRLEEAIKLNADGAKTTDPEEKEQ